MKNKEPMSNSHFRMMTYLFKIRDFFKNPKKYLENNIPLAAGSIVVDFGCGPGSFTIPLAEIVTGTGKVYGVDIQPLAIESLMKKMKKKNLTNIEPVLIKEGYDTGILSNSVDVILFFDTYHHIPEKKALFDEFYRILDDDGKIFMDAGHLPKQKALSFLGTLSNFEIESKNSDKIIVKKNVLRGNLE